MASVAIFLFILGVSAIGIITGLHGVFVFFTQKQQNVMDRTGQLFFGILAAACSALIIFLTLTQTELPK
ncbi:MAG: hypothetical protein A2599_00600 [Candidatus Staskawiczbacteria bacterium RIFOXYD1_FULL_39_28]|uniref:Uncharacterized protein n=1 Tax=Candidatus Staskawiczbacteria bacterium RIFOXYC1_FULL_38_18 TaxID=1802229 RepID=A0A1G2JAM3_9BACT|nr:MAG: hypothetical protein A2401_02465 [Candidatus Staskawiczbacteria bacterium RIFOXYC1_FULL_38_18]OGZ91467.1 MAG: hypothetical protein A2599_00600 [Candidatus Staskawiczbacteria bacterium RIFOXYD1_FULL_39_28]